MDASSANYDPLLTKFNAYDLDKLINVSKKLNTRERDIVMKAMKFRVDDKNNLVKQKEVDNLVVKLSEITTGKPNAFEKLWNTINYLSASLLSNIMQSKYIKSEELSRLTRGFQALKRNDIFEKASGLSQFISEHKVSETDRNEIKLKLKEFEEKNIGQSIENADKKILIHLSYGIMQLENIIKSEMLNGDQLKSAGDFLKESYENKIYILKELIREIEKKQTGSDDSTQNRPLQALRQDLSSTLEALKTNNSQIVENLDQSIRHLEAAIAVNDLSVDKSQQIGSLAQLYRSKLKILAPLKFNNPEMAIVQRQIEETQRKLSALKIPTKIGKNPRVLG